MTGSSAPPKRRRVPRPPWVWCRIIRASTELTALQKLVWDECRGLSNGKGATMGPLRIAQRLGVHRDTIKQAREGLVDLGLGRTVDLGRGVSHPWFPELPETCRPLKTCLRLDDDELLDYAEALDRHIREVRSRGRETPTAAAETAPAEAPAAGVAAKHGAARGRPTPTRDSEMAGQGDGPTPTPGVSGPLVRAGNSQWINDLREASNATRGERGDRGSTGKQALQEGGGHLGVCDGDGVDQDQAGDDGATGGEAAGPGLEDWEPPDEPPEDLDEDAVEWEDGDV